MFGLLLSAFFLILSALVRRGRSSGDGGSARRAPSTGFFLFLFYFRRKFLGRKFFIGFPCDFKSKFTARTFRNF